MKLDLHSLIILSNFQHLKNGKKKLRLRILTQVHSNTNGSRGEKGNSLKISLYRSLSLRIILIIQALEMICFLEREIM